MWLGARISYLELTSVPCVRWSHQSYRNLSVQYECNLLILFGDDGRIVISEQHPSPAVSGQEGVMSLSRCLRCESLYYNDRVEPNCRYHVGQFRAWWSCCKEPLYSARGCRSGMHVEDQSYTQVNESAPLSARPLLGH